MQEEENVVGDQAALREYFNSEEINACQHGHVRPNEVRPVHLLPTLSSRADTVPTKDVTDGLVGNVVAEVL